MDPSNEKPSKAFREIPVLVRGRPAREGERTRVGVPFAVVERPPQQAPSKAGDARSPSELARIGTEEPVAYLSHLISHLREERKRRGKSLADLSAVSGLDRGMLCKLENGRIGNPTFLTLWKYAMALDARPSLVLLDACRVAAEAEASDSATME